MSTIDLHRKELELIDKLNHAKEMQETIKKELSKRNEGQITQATMTPKLADIQSHIEDLEERLLIFQTLIRLS